MQRNIYQRQWKIAGKAGEGEMVSSKLMAQVFQQLGLSVFAYYEYPSLIKGGHQTGQVIASSRKFDEICQRRHVDMLVALSQSALTGHEPEISSNSIVIVNQQQTTTIEKAQNVDVTNTNKPITHVLPLSELARLHAGTQLATNIAVLGVSAWCLNLPVEQFRNVITKEFYEKSEELVEKNLAVFFAAYELAKTKKLPQFAEPPENKNSNILLTGNEAVGLGALAGGVQFYSAYPMTPASGLLHYLAEQQQNYPIIVKHAEDEIAAINHAIGASFAGVRAMTGSAGGGFALMVESVSLLGVTELPLVILVGQRPGPATGLPTWTTQADLQFVLHAGHGEFPRIVLTPGSIQEHYTYTKLACDLAEKYQIPVFILSDKYLLESHQTMTAPDSQQVIRRESMMADTTLSPADTYRRYLDTTHGISPRSIPGQPLGLHMANSYEHDEYGYATESADQTTLQNKKRLRKLVGRTAELPTPRLVGDSNAQTCLVSWGSTISVTAGVALASAGQVMAVHIPCVWPFPTKQLEQLTSEVKTVIVVEGNATGQLEQLIRQETKIKVQDALRRFDGRPFYQEEIIEWLSLKHGLQFDLERGEQA